MWFKCGQVFILWHADLHYLSNQYISHASVPITSNSSVPEADWKPNKWKHKSFSMSQSAVNGKESSVEVNKKKCYFLANPSLVCSAKDGAGEAVYVCLCEERPNNLSNTHPPLLTDMFRWASLVSQCALYYSISHPGGRNNTWIIISIFVVFN